MKYFTIANYFNYFSTLAILAAFLLWGISIWNGTIKALLLAVWYQKFEDGTRLNTNYTGIVILDFPLSILVAFFLSSTNNSDRGQQLFTIDVFSTLQPAYVWLYLESARGTKKSPALENPIVWTILWQIFGGAILLPIYFHCHLKWLSKQPDALAPPCVASSRAMPISYMVGAILPTIMAMLPTWNPLDPIAHQRILAAWQLCPVWVSLSQTAITWMLNQYANLLSGKSSRTQIFDNKKAAWWSQVSYLLAAASSFAGHSYVLTTMAFSSDPVLSLQRTHLPTFFAGPQGSPYILTKGPWLFLQSDAIILSLSSVSWAYILVSRLLACRSGKSSDRTSAHSSLLLPALFVIGGSILGPGTVVCLTLYWREGELLSFQSAAPAVLIEADTDVDSMHILQARRRQGHRNGLQD